MRIETTKMSSRGQIVIPQDIRRQIGADEGTIFLVMANEDSLILKKVYLPSKDEVIKNLDKIAAEGQKRAKKLGINEKNVQDIVHNLRKSRRRHAPDFRH